MPEFCIFFLLIVGFYKIKLKKKKKKKKKKKRYQLSHTFLKHSQDSNILVKLNRPLL